ncbi:MAG: hypothetical protein IJ875_04280, partial [Solobacterium sp.]|nr:hypothetical protein [Solobacterium sp.]
MEQSVESWMSVAHEFIELFKALKKKEEIKNKYDEQILLANADITTLAVRGTRNITTVLGEPYIENCIGEILVNDYDKIYENGELNVKKLADTLREVYKDENLEYFCNMPPTKNSKLFTMLRETIENYQDKELQSTGMYKDEDLTMAIEDTFINYINSLDLEAISENFKASKEEFQERWEDKDDAKFQSAVRTLEGWDFKKEIIPQNIKDALEEVGPFGAGYILGNEAQALVDRYVQTFVNNGALESSHEKSGLHNPLILNNQGSVDICNVKQALRDAYAKGSSSSLNEVHTELEIFDETFIEDFNTQKEITPELLISAMNALDAKHDGDYTISIGNMILAYADTLPTFEEQQELRECVNTD